MLKVTTTPVGTCHVSNRSIQRHSFMGGQIRSTLQPSLRVSRSRNLTLKTRMGLFGLGLPELAVIAGVSVLIFGPKKLPELGKTLGTTVKSFQTAAREFEQELKSEIEEGKEEQSEKEEKVEKKQDKSEQKTEQPVAQDQSEQKTEQPVAAGEPKKTES
eukprot:TRINITY_DN2787_c0_g3_i2.p2 TRINITY_DN2787_c0_g3~~TRINITY_DN2787_c0_g3_i2.p2  ORF type:complete len:170 (+),score=27.75 TRINITY_DN2787_c0_g3_i2:34-510(+)